MKTETGARGDRMENWDIRPRLLSPIAPKCCAQRRDPAIAIRLPSGEELQQHHVHERADLDVADGEIEMAQDGSSVTGGMRIPPALGTERAQDGAC